MSDDDQERFEDFLELEHYIEELQAGKAAHLPQDLTPSQARIYRMAAQFCSASPKANEPSAQFVMELRERLFGDNAGEELEEPTEKHQAIASKREVPQQEMLPTPLLEEEPTTRLQAVKPPADSGAKQPQRVRFVSRRSLLAGGAVAAASLAIGTGVGATLSATRGSNHIASMPTTPAPVESYDQSWLVQSGPNGVQTTWHYVTTLAQLGNQAVEFFARGVVGYVILKKADLGDKQAQNEVIALSAACTHMGCIVQWQDNDQRFHCPCHGGLFTRYGQPDDSGPMRYLAALPRLRVKIENANVYVEVPKID